MEFDEDAERGHLAKLIALLLERAFGKSSEFDHMFMSAGEALGRCLCQFSAAHFDGSLLILEMPKTWIVNKVQCADLLELPALNDVVDVLLSFEAQYGIVPNDYQIGQKARFAADVTRVLCDLGLLNNQARPSDFFLMMMVNHYFLKPKNGVWDDEIELLLMSVAEETWDLAPSEYKNVILGDSERPLTWAEGYLERRWRYGIWLSERQLIRALNPSHSALPNIITRSLADGSNSTGRN